jgi:hypothetical protein
MLSFCFHTKYYFFVLLKSKKFTLEQTVKAQRGSRGIALLFLFTSVLEGGGWSMPFPSHFTSGKEVCYSLYRRLGGLQDQFRQVCKISPLPGFNFLVSLLN